jgi:hypothetical protein
MTNRVSYAVLIVFLGPLILADFYGVASLAINVAIVSLAAILVLSAKVRVSTGLSPWIMRRVSREAKSVGPIGHMALKVDGAAAGYSFSREEVARLLASAFVVKTKGSFGPSGSSIEGAREQLKALAGNDPNVSEVFEEHPDTKLSRFRSGRKKKEEESSYLSGLESAIRLVREAD